MEGPKRYKAPYEKNFLTINNYSYVDPKFKQWINRGKNYGILTGIRTPYGYLTVLDADTPTIINPALQKLPNTFRILTGSGGYHFYFYTDQQTPTTPLQKNGVNIGHIKGPGGYVVGPGSYHVNNKFYGINSNTEIATISTDRLLTLFEPYLPGNENKNSIDNTTVKITATQEINNSDIETYCFPLTKEVIGHDIWRKKTNNTILKTDPTPKEKVGCVCTLLNVAKWDPQSILHFLGRFCRWSNFDFDISQRHIDYLFKNYSHPVSDSGKYANTRGVFSGDFAPCISDNTPLSEKGYGKQHTPDTGEPWFKFKKY